jgi:hypothetical protein
VRDSAHGATSFFALFLSFHMKLVRASSLMDFHNITSYRNGLQEACIALQGYFILYNEGRKKFLTSKQ